MTGRGVFSPGNGETTTRYDHKDKKNNSKRDISQDKKSLLLIDNCSTRVNEALDKAGGELVLPIDPPLAVQPGSAGARAMLSGLPVTVISIPQGTNVSNLRC